MTEIISVYRPQEPIKYTHDQWNKLNGGYGALIIEAAGSDSLVQYFREVMRDAEYITPDDPRLAIAYGYFVFKGIMTAEKASEITGLEIVSISRDYVLDALGL